MAPSADATWALAVVAALSLAPRLWVALHHPLSYNGSWHLFIARNLSREYANLAHPPLFLLLLKACDAVSHTLLSFRFFPLLAGVGSVYLVGRVLLKLQTLPAVAVLGALAMACSQAAIILSNLVQGYMLCVFLVLASFFHYLDLVRMDRLPDWRIRFAFSAFASLALVVEYVAGMFLIACAVAPLVAAAALPAYRRAVRQAFPRRWVADLLTSVPPVLVGGALYFLFARRWPISGITFPAFYFQPSIETVTDFLTRGITGIVNLFAPVVLPTPLSASILLAVFLIAVVAAPATEQVPGAHSANRIFPALLLTVLLCLGMALGLSSRYPFGGDGQRHQILLFVFALLAGFVGLDRLLRASTAPIRLALIALCLCAIGTDLALNRQDIVHPELEALISKVGVYEQNLSLARTVHLDQFNLMGFFMEYYGWDCRFAGHAPENPRVERYELSRGRRKLTVIAHRNLWIMDFTNPVFYAELRASFAAREDPCEAVFCISRNIYGRPPWVPWPGTSRNPSPEGELPDRERARLRAAIPTMASAQHLETRRLVLGDYVSADFCLDPHTWGAGSNQAGAMQ